MALQGVVAGNDLGAYRQAKGWPNPFTDTYACRDGVFVVLAIINREREYPQLAAALDRGGWLEDERFKTVAAVLEHRPAFREALSEAFAELDYDDLALRFDGAGITYSRVQPMADVLEDAQLRANDIVVETGDDGDGYALTINSPISVREAPKKSPSRGPDIGAHSLEVLRELAFDEAYIQELAGSGVIIAADAGGTDGTAG